MNEKKYTLWINYYSEGWRPEEPMSAEEVLNYIQEGNILGNPIRITTEAKLTIN